VDRRELAYRFMYGRVIDIGCGDAVMLWGGHPPDYVTCVDLDIYPHTHVQAAAEALPFRDNAFDTALLLDVLEHVDDVEAALKEALRVARRAIISYPDESYEECRARRPDINAFIAFERALGLREPYAEGEMGFRAHYHWKTRDRIMRDIGLLRSYCQQEFKLRYPDYDGWGFVCDRQA